MQRPQFIDAEFVTLLTEHLVKAGVFYLAEALNLRLMGRILIAQAIDSAARKMAQI